MKKKWDWRVYMDLFAGAGHSKLRGTNRCVKASPLLSLQVSEPFDRYIFCERTEKYVDALGKRVSNTGIADKVRIVPGNVNQLTDKILKEMPPYGPGSKVLTFCFADPCKIRDLQFSTVQRLSSLFVDFLILLPTGMDGHRNRKTYLRDDNTIVEDFLGMPKWRDKWKRAELDGKPFGRFLEETYCDAMKSLDYQFGGLGDSKLIRSTDKNLPLYRLAFFSRSGRGEEFWKEARKYSDFQLDLF